MFIETASFLYTEHTLLHVRDAFLPLVEVKKKHNMSTVKFDNMSTNRIEILGQTTIKCLLFIYEYKFIGFDN